MRGWPSGYPAIPTRSMPQARSTPLSMSCCAARISPSGEARSPPMTRRARTSASPLSRVRRSAAAAISGKERAAIWGTGVRPTSRIARAAATTSSRGRLGTALRKILVPAGRVSRKVSASAFVGRVASIEARRMKPAMRETISLAGGAASFVGVLEPKIMALSLFRGSGSVTHAFPIKAWIRGPILGRVSPRMTQMAVFSVMAGRRPGHPRL